jgi:hypothetical protein
VVQCTYRFDYVLLVQVGGVMRRTRVGTALGLAAVVTLAFGGPVRAGQADAVDHGWSTAQRLADGSTSNDWVDTTDTAVNSSGGALVAWTQEGVHVARATGASTPDWSGPELSAAGNNIRVALGEEGHGAAVWRLWEDSRPRLFIAFMTPDGTWSLPMVLSNSGRPRNSLQPLAITEDGSTHVGWRSRRGRFIATFDAGGALLDRRVLSDTTGVAPVLTLGWEGRVDAWYGRRTEDGDATLELRSWVKKGGWSAPLRVDTGGPYYDIAFASDPLADIRYAAWLGDDARRFFVVAREGSGKWHRILAREIVPHPRPCIEPHLSALSAAGGHLVVGWAVQRCEKVARFGVKRRSPEGVWSRAHVERVEDHVFDPTMAAGVTRNGSTTMIWSSFRLLTSNYFGPTADRVHARDFKRGRGWGQQYLLGAGEIWTLGWPKAPSFAMSHNGRSVIAWTADRIGGEASETLLARHRASVY